MELLRLKPMRPRGRRASVLLCLAPAVCCVLAAGCNSGKQLHRDLIARELRLQEDEIYRLEDYLEEYQRKVCALRKENRDLKDQIGELGSPRSASPTPVRDEGSSLDLPDDTEPSNRDASENDDRFIPPEVPVIDFGTPIDSPESQEGEAGPGSLPPPIDIPAGDEPPPFRPTDTPAPPATETAPEVETIIPEEILTPPLEPLSIDLGVEELTPIADAMPPIQRAPVEETLNEAPPEPSPEIKTVERILVRSEPGPPLDDGQKTLVVSVTPEWADRVERAFSGELSVMLRDPEAAAGDSTRLARWDYSAEEVAATASEEGNGSEGLELLIGLPDGAPSGLPLELWVRLTDTNGVKTLGVAPVSLPQAKASAPVIALAPELRRAASPQPLAPAIAATPQLVQQVPTPRLASPPSLAAPGPVKRASWATPTLEPPASVESSIRVRDAITRPAEPAGSAAAPNSRWPANPWQQKGRGAKAPRPLKDPGISFEP